MPLHAHLCPTAARIKPREDRVHAHLSATSRPLPCSWSSNRARPRPISNGCAGSPRESAAGQDRRRHRRGAPIAAGQERRGAPIAAGQDRRGRAPQGKSAAGRRSPQGKIAAGQARREGSRQGADSPPAPITYGAEGTVQTSAGRSACQATMTVVSPLAAMALGDVSCKGPGTPSSTPSARHSRPSSEARMLAVGQ